MSSFHCPWYFKNSWGSKMFNNYSEKLKNENCAQCNHSYERKKIYKDVWMREWDEYCNDGWMFLNKCPTMMCLAKKKKRSALFSAVTKSGRVWRKVPQSEAWCAPTTLPDAGHGCSRPSTREEAVGLPPRSWRSQWTCCPVSRTGWDLDSMAKEVWSQQKKRKKKRKW